MMPAQMIQIHSQPDVELARREARSFALATGPDRERAEMVVLAVSELSMNLLRYAQDGSVVFSDMSGAHRQGIQVESHDTGPGIPDLNLAMQDNYSTSGGLGSGLPAVRRMMDEFDIRSGPEGTMVTARKWMTRSGR